MYNIFNRIIRKHNSSQSRKELSESRLEKLGIIYNNNLPFTIEKDEVIIRDAKEVSSKIVSLWEVVNIANESNNSSRTESIEFLKDKDLWESLSPFDQEFLISDKHSEQRIIDMTWRTEVLKVLFWSLNEVPSLGKPIEDGSLVKISRKVQRKYNSMDSFLNFTKLRPTKEIFNEADFIYRLHWCSREHRRNNQNVPSSYNYSVIRERDFALRWLTNPILKWDEISLDT